MNDVSNRITSLEEIKILSAFRTMNNEQKTSYMDLAALLSNEICDYEEKVIKNLHDNFPYLKNTIFFDELCDYLVSQNKQSLNKGTL